MAVVVDLAEVVAVRLAHANEHWALGVAIVPMAAPVQIRAVYVVPEELHPVQPEQLPAAFGHGKLDLRIVAAILSVPVVVL